MAGYASVICNYCPCSDYGFASVNTGPWNLCEGAHCAEALEAYNDNQEDEEDKIKSLEDAF